MSGKTCIEIRNIKKFSPTICNKLNILFFSLYNPWLRYSFELYFCVYVYIPELYVDSGKVPPGAATDRTLELDCRHCHVGILPHCSQTEPTEGVATVE